MQLTGTKYLYLLSIWQLRIPCTGQKRFKNRFLFLSVCLTPPPLIFSPEPSLYLSLSPSPSASLSPAISLPPLSQSLSVSLSRSLKED